MGSKSRLPQLLLSWHPMSLLLRLPLLLELDSARMTCSDLRMLGLRDIVYGVGDGIRAAQGVLETLVRSAMVTRKHGPAKTGRCGPLLPCTSIALLGPVHFILQPRCLCNMHLKQLEMDRLHQYAPIA